MTPKLPPLSSREVIAVLRKAGFEEAPNRGKGSHRAFAMTGIGGVTRLVIVPHERSIPKGTLAAIIKQSGIAREKFLELLRRN